MTMSELMNFILNQGDTFRRARLPSLYADFTLQRTSNPDGFAANVAAWQEVLVKAARAGVLPANDGNTHDTLSLKTGEPLLRALETKEWGRPLALGTVIDQSISHRHMMPYEEYIKAPQNIHSRYWTVQPWWLLSWGLKHLSVIGPSNSAGTLPTGELIILANVELAGDKIISQMGMLKNQADRIYPMRVFRERAAETLGLKGQMTESDLAIILIALAREKGAIVYDCEVVKFKAPGEILAPLSDQDKTIASLKVLIRDLTMQIELLANKISDITATAQKAIGRKDRTTASAALKSRKLNESVLTQKTKTLQQLEDIFHKIEQAHDQVAIIKVMEGSTSVLRNLRAQTGGVDKVEDIVDNLRDEMQQVDEVGGFIEAGGEGNAADEDAVDKELEQMMQQVNVDEEEKEAQRVQRKLAEIETDCKPMMRQSAKTEGLVDAGVAALMRLSLDEDPARPDQPSTPPTALVEAAPGG